MVGVERDHRALRVAQGRVWNGDVLKPGLLRLAEKRAIYIDLLYGYLAIRPAAG